MITIFLQFLQAYWTQDEAEHRLIELWHPGEQYVYIHHVLHQMGLHPVSCMWCDIDDIGDNMVIYKSLWQHNLYIKQTIHDHIQICFNPRSGFAIGPNYRRKKNNPMCKSTIAVVIGPVSGGLKRISLHQYAMQYQAHASIPPKGTLGSIQLCQIVRHGNALNFFHYRNASFCQYNIKHIPNSAPCNHSNIRQYILLFLALKAFLPYTELCLANPSHISKHTCNHA